MTPLVSVIVPVFNVEDFALSCLESIAAQTYSDIEIVIVDDGSQDGSGAICDAFAARESRARVIHQRNSGLSAARNTGLDLITGDFVTFVDGDDLLAPDFVAALLADALTYDAEVVVTDFVSFVDAPPDYSGSAEREVLTGPAEVAVLVTGRPPKWAGPTKLYRAELFSPLRFHPGVLYEDVDFTVRLLPLVHRIVLRTDRLYGYRQRVGSIMDRNRAGVSPDLITVLETSLHSARATLPPAVAERVQTALILHASGTLESIAPGAPWAASAGYRTAYTRLLRPRVRTLATDRGISIGYRGLLIVSAFSPNAFRRLIDAARWAKKRPGLRGIRRRAR